MEQTEINQRLDKMRQDVLSRLDAEIRRDTAIFFSLLTLRFASVLTSILLRWWALSQIFNLYIGAGIVAAWVAVDWVAVSFLRARDDQVV